MNVFFSVGEPSGDLHGASLIEALRRERPDIDCVGFGGPRMAEAGCRLDFELTELAVMGFVRVLRHVPRLWRLLSQAQRLFRERRPDAVVLIDYPGFNFHVARLAKAAGVPVFFYGAPQVWAWGGWRVGKVRRLVDHLLCMLPFEEDWFRRRGVHATYVGHPFFDELATHRPREHFLERFASAGPGRPVVTLLPGSRGHEVENNLPAFLRAGEIIQRELPSVRFALAAYNEKLARVAGRLISAQGLPVEIHVNRGLELMRLADCCLATSGSVSLELMYHLKPTVIHYQAPWWGMLAQRLLRNVKYVTLVNILAKDDAFGRDLRLFDPRAADADTVPFPEYVTAGDKSAQMAEHAVEWLTDPAARQKKVDQLRDLKARYAQPGASDRAAGYVLRQLGAQRDASGARRSA